MMKSTVLVKSRLQPLILVTLATLVQVIGAIMPAAPAAPKMIVPTSTSTATTTHTWTYTTFWSPYHSSWPMYQTKTGHRPLRPGGPMDNFLPATNRLFPSHPTTKHYPTSSAVIKPEHRLFPGSFRPPDVDGGQGPASVQHRYVSYMSSTGTSLPFETLRTKRSTKTTAGSQLAISSTSVLFPRTTGAGTPLPQGTTDVPHPPRNKVNDSNTPAKTEGKLVMEGLSLIGSLLRPTGSRPSLFSSVTNGLGPLLGQGTTGGHHHNHPLLASSSGLNLPFLTSPLSSASTLMQHYAPHHLGSNRPLHDLHSYLFPAASNLYPSTIFPAFMPPYGSLHSQQQQQQQQQQQKPHDSSPFYSGIPPSPYQALGVDNLLVPLVSMIGLNLLRPDIIKSRREGVLSDVDGIDVFRNLDLGDDCLKRLACEAGVTVTDADDATAIQKALERALAARRTVPNRHLGLKPDEVERLQCSRHSCSSIDAISTAEADDLTEKVSSAFQFVQDS